MKAHEYMYTIRENFDEYAIQLHQDGSNIIFDFPNPYGGEGVSVCFYKEQFTLYFGRYHAHFCYDDEEFAELQNVLNGIFQCKYVVLYCMSGKHTLRCVMGELSDIPGDLSTLAEALSLGNQTDDLSNLMIEIQCWNPAENRIIK